MIVPSKGIGPIQLGDSKSSVHKVCGSPSSIFLSGKLGDETESYSNGLTVRYRNNKVAEVEIRAKPYATAGGISVGSSPQTIRSVFKGGIQTPYKLKYRKPPVTIYLYHDIKRGIAFWFGDNAQNSTARCDAIVVHRSGGYMGGGMPNGTRR